MNKNASVNAVTSVISAATPSQAGGDFQKSPAQQEAERAARYRLVIEEGANGAFVYKTMDRVTGEVIRQLPREQVVRMAEGQNYGAGSVIDTSA